MKSTLGVADPTEFVHSQGLNERLSQLLAQGFTVLDGAIVFTSLRKIAESVPSDNFPDLTGFECFVNHIHIEEQSDGPIDSAIALLRRAIALALAVQNELRARFPGKAFRVIVAESAFECVVRFHVVRPHEEWLASDLDGYGEEEILVLD